MEIYWLGVGLGTAMSSFLYMAAKTKGALDTLYGRDTFFSRAHISFINRDLIRLGKAPITNENDFQRYLSDFRNTGKMKKCSCKNKSLEAEVNGGSM